RLRGSSSTPVTNPRLVSGPRIWRSAGFRSPAIVAAAVRSYARRLLRLTSVITSRLLSGSTAIPLKTGNGSTNVRTGIRSPPSGLGLFAGWLSCADDQADQNTATAAPAAARASVLRL